MTVRRILATLIALFAVAGCETQPSRADPTVDVSTAESATSTVSGLPASIEVFADYPRYLWHKRRLAIATTNNGTEPVTVTRITLRSDHFTVLPAEAKRSVVPPGSRVDIQTDFGELGSCTATDRSAAVELDLAIGEEPARTVVAKLDPTPLDEMLDRECAALRITDAVAIEFADRWETTDRGLATTITLRRRTAGSIRVESIRGTEIFAMHETSSPPLLPLELGDDMDVPIELFVIRCDPHAVGQSTRTYEFKIWVGVDAEEPRLTVLDPSPEFRTALNQLITTCIDQHSDGES